MDNLMIYWVYATAAPLIILISIKNHILFRVDSLFFIGMGAIAIIMLIIEYRKKIKNKKVWNEIRQTIDWV